MSKKDTKQIFVRASIGLKILTNADRYFTNDIRVIAAELLQNARRAGASRVSVDIDRLTGTIRVDDDGRGLHADQAHVLLAFGTSSSAEVTEHDEAPAGMGFFSLAGRGATVESADWRLAVTAEAFRGNAVAELERGRARRVGTAVTFPALTGGTNTASAEVIGAFSKAAAAMPFATFIDGREVRRHRPIDQLLRPDGSPAYTQCTSGLVGDCSLVAARFEDGRARVANLSPYDPRVDDRWLDVVCDVFGQVIRLSEAEVRGLHPVLESPAEEPILSRSLRRDGRWLRRIPRYLVVLEAVGSRTLVPRLPDRGALVRTEGLAEVGLAIAEAVAVLVARSPSNGVADDHPLRRVATGSGLSLPRRQVVAYAPRARSRNAPSGLRDDPTGAGPGQAPLLVMNNGAVAFRDPTMPGDGRLALLPVHGAAFSALVSAATGGAGRRLATRLVEANGPLPGIDPLVALDLEIDGVTVPLARGPDFRDDALAQAWLLSGLHKPFVGAVAITLILETRTGRVMRAPLDFAIMEQGAGSGRHSVVATPSASPAACVGAMVATHPWYDSDGETWDVQLEAFRGSASSWIRERILPPVRLAGECVAEAAERLLADGLDRSVRSIVVTFSGAGDAKVVATTRQGRTWAARLPRGPDRA